MEIIILLLSCLIKLLLANTYPSTDYDVHKNWKDITNSTSIRNWYYDNRSIWTLDYPPLFAYMEYILGNIANLIDSNFKTSINIQNNYSNQKDSNLSCLYYHRITVVLLSDICLYFSVKK